MRDYPPAKELLEAIAAFLSEEVVGELEGRKRFFAIVATNLCHILARESEFGAAIAAEQCRDLWELLGREGVPPPGADHDDLALELSHELCRRIREGDADEGEMRAQVLEYLRTELRARLDINNPGFG
ncbi:MAG: DUF6285 domain-containing protein [Candidatus Binatia bacterium]